MAKYWKPALLTDTKLRTGKCRLSYPHLYVKYDKSGKYQTICVWSKTDEQMTKAARTCEKNAKQKGIKEKWGGKVPKGYEGPIRDGDDSEYEEYKGCYYMTAKNGNRKPEVIDLERDLILDPDEVYPGCYARVTITFYPYSNSGNNGVGCILGNVQKLEDGERWGGGASSADDDFDDDDDDVNDMEEDDDDDLMG